MPPSQVPDDPAPARYPLAEVDQGLPGAARVIVATRRLALREMTDDDLDQLALLLGDDEVMRYYPRAKTRDEVRRWIAWNRRLYRERGFGLWIMTLKDGGRFVGECGLTVQTVDGVDEVEVGYHVLPAFQRRGYATEAAAACCAAARDGFGVDRVIAVIHPDNAASRLVAERLGLRPEKHAQMYGEDRLIYAAPAGAADPVS